MGIFVFESFSWGLITADLFSYIHEHYHPHTKLFRKGIQIKYTYLICIFGRSVDKWIMPNFLCGMPLYAHQTKKKSINIWETFKIWCVSWGGFINLLKLWPVSTIYIYMHINYLIIMLCAYGGRIIDYLPHCSHNHITTIIIIVKLTLSCRSSSGRLSTGTYSGYWCNRYSTAGAIYGE